MGKWTELGQKFCDKYAAAEEHHEPKPTELDELKNESSKT